MDAFTIAIISKIGAILGKYIAKKTGIPELDLGTRVLIKFSANMSGHILFDIFEYIDNKIGEDKVLKVTDRKLNSWELNYQNIYGNLTMAIWLDGKHKRRESEIYYKSFYNLGKTRLALPEQPEDRHESDPRYKLAITMDYFGQLLAYRGIVKYP